MKRATYHHGDLRRVLIDASVELVESAGVSALSLREVARHAGVSHSAPYHYFPEKASLLAAVAEQGFVELARDMAAAQARVPDDPLALLEARGEAYVNFALRSPSRFRMMFRPELATPELYPTIYAASTAAFGMLVESVSACQREGLAPAGDPMPLVLTCWSAVHGLATLWLDGPLSKDPSGFGGSPERLTAMVVRTVSSLFAQAGTARRGTGRTNRGARANGTVAPVTGKAGSLRVTRKRRNTKE